MKTGSLLGSAMPLPAGDAQALPGAGATLPSAIVAYADLHSFGVHEPLLSRCSQHSALTRVRVPWPMPTAPP